VTRSRAHPCSTSSRVGARRISPSFLAWDGSAYRLETRSVESTKQPNKKNDRDRNSDQPQNQCAAH
jgi:hypothetical protein